MTNLDSILKSKDIALSSQGYGFSVVMYGCESWTIKKAEELMLLKCGVGEDS